MSDAPTVPPAAASEGGPPEGDLSTRILTRAAFLALCCFAVFHLSANEADVDLWGHVLFGQRMIEFRGVETIEPFSWTAQGLPWTNHEKLSEVALGAAHFVGGGSGILLLKLLIGLGTFAVALSTGTRGLRGWGLAGAYAIAAISMVELGFGFAARPQIFTAIALAVQIWIMREVHEGRIRWALALPPLYVVWVNTHGGALAGLALLAACAVAAVADAVLRPRFAWFQPHDGTAPDTSRRTLATAVLLVPACAAAMCVNPYGAHLPLWLVESVSWVRPEIQEWNPVPLGSAALNHSAMFLLAGLTIVVMAARSRRIPWWEAALLAALLFAASRHVRHTPLFAIAAMALLPRHAVAAAALVSDRLESFAALFASRRARLIMIFIMGSLAKAFIIAAVELRKEHFYSMEVPRNKWPLSAIEFIRDHDIRGDAITFFDWGEQMLWELPDARVSIDGRLDTCYPRPVIRAHWHFYNGLGYDRTILDPSRADFALLPVNLKAVYNLSYEEGWKPVYYDELAAVFVRDPSRFPALAGMKLPVAAGPEATRGSDFFPHHTSANLGRPRALPASR